MSDLDNLAALKRMLENRPEEQSEKVEIEKKFIGDVSMLLNGKSYEEAVTVGINDYDPNKLIEFLNRPSEEVQKAVGGEWLTMDPMAFEAMTYTVRQKIQKSTVILDWYS